MKKRIDPQTLKNNFMKKYNWFFLFLVLIMNIHCRTSKEISNCDKLVTSINSDKFVSFFRLCEKEQNKIQIYDATGKFTDCKSFVKSCNKNVIVTKKYFEYDVNKIEKNRVDKGIILYEYTTTPTKYTISFLDTYTNSSLKLTLNSKNKLVKVKGGSF